MQISQKCQYALRAVFELAVRASDAPVTVKDIAEAQAIPPRFLEVILNQLKKGGFVASTRGAAGGYSLARSPDKLTMGEIIRFVEGPFQAVSCTTGHSEDRCSLYGDCVFLSVWEEATKAMSDVFDHTTFRDLVKRCKPKEVPASAYCI
ncbi:MAG: Rrf2 family transcriptional regulator [Planctomycetota bacterium]|nr:Rrf2 family transcriptional regulator [Planctomycetota bacterium]